jgi:hypothetical protein
VPKKEIIIIIIKITRLIVFGCKHRSPQTTPISEFGHVDASFTKMAANKIGKLLMVSDFNENLYLGVF